MKYRILSRLIASTLLFGLTFLAIQSTAFAQRSLEWRDDGLWVIDVDDEYYFDPLSQVAETAWEPRIAALSPDGNWVAYVRHTGGGFENEGQSLYIAHWSGEEVRLLLETDRLIPAIYWLEINGENYVAAQQMTGGTCYGSFFTIIEQESGDIVTQVGGLIYGTVDYGSRYVPAFIGTVVGLKYEVPSHDETPVAWGIFFIDELISFTVDQNIETVNGAPPEESALTDGRLTTAWIEPDENQPSFTLEFKEGIDIRGICIQSGWQWHQPPAPDEFAWSGTDWFPLYDRPREILIEFDDGTSMTYDLEDKRSVQWIDFNLDRSLSSIRVTILSVYCGIEFDQVAISEVLTY